MGGVGRRREAWGGVGRCGEAWELCDGRAQMVSPSLVNALSVILISITTTIIAIVTTIVVVIIIVTITIDDTSAITSAPR